MIDKINGNESFDFHGRNSTNKRKNPAVRAYENTSGAGEAGKKRAEGIHKKGSALADRKESGVILDLSGKDAGKKKAGAAASRKKDSSWADALRRLITPVVKWLKDFWESDRSAENNAEAADAETAETKIPGADITEMEAADASNADSLPPLDELSGPDEQKELEDESVKSGDLQRIEQFVTQNGAKRLAHNSDLLTYYDRRGKFVEMDETEKYRVLFGDKNVLKL